MNNPEITIVIPVYNREILILETLESVKKQSFTNWECIIVDDYSIDNTKNNVLEYIKDDKRFFLIEKINEKKGAPSSRNIGWRASKSQFILFLDSDDLLTPSSLQKRFTNLSYNKSIDFNLSTNVEFKKSSNHKSSRSLFKVENPLEKFLSFNAAWQTSSPTWKKSFLEKIDGWDEEALSWQDGEIHIRALLKKPKFDWIDEQPNVLLRTTPSSSISYQSNVLKYVNNLKIFTKIYSSLNLKDKKLFKENIYIWLYNLVEKLNYSDALFFIEQSDFSTFDFSKSKIKFYCKTYHFSKNIFILKSVVYQLRNNFKGLPIRKKFFQKQDISSSSLRLLKSELKDIELFTKNIDWLND